MSPGMPAPHAPRCGERAILQPLRCLHGWGRSEARRVCEPVSVRRPIALAAAVLALAAPSVAAAGRTEPRIVGGERIDIADAPWQVALAFSPDYRPGSASERAFCGGVLVAPSIALTAGHCVYDDNLGAFRPASELSVIGGRTALDSAGGAEVAVQDYRLPSDAAGEPIYEEINGHARWDVVVLRLASEVPGTPIRIAGADEAELWSRGQPVLATGWGTTTKLASRSPRGLKGATLTAFDDETCASTYPGPGGFDSADMMCTSGIGIDTCKGDSGGPVVAFTASGEPRLVGLTSWGGDGYGSPCAWVAGVYTRIAGDPLRSQVAAIVRDLGGGDVAGSGGRAAATSPALTVAEALQLTYNRTRDLCSALRRCWNPLAPACSQAGESFRCEASFRRELKRQRQTCSLQVTWSAAADGTVAGESTRRRCR